MMIEAGIIIAGSSQRCGFACASLCLDQRDASYTQARIKGIAVAAFIPALPQFRKEMAIPDQSIWPPSLADWRGKASALIASFWIARSWPCDASRPGRRRHVGRGSLGKAWQKSKRSRPTRAGN